MEENRNDAYAIITLVPPPHPDHVGEVLALVSETLEDEYPVHVINAYRSPLGLGLFCFVSELQRQIVLDALPIPFG